MDTIWHNKATIVKIHNYVDKSKHHNYFLLHFIASVTKVPQRRASLKMLERTVDKVVYKYSQEQIKTQCIENVHETR